jgi:uncharacterized membrane protein
MALDAPGQRVHVSVVRVESYMPDISISQSAPGDAARARHDMMKDVWTYTAVLFVVAILVTLLLTGSVIALLPVAILCLSGGAIVTVWGLLRLRSYERASDSNQRAFPRIFD